MDDCGRTHVASLSDIWVPQSPPRTDADDDALLLRHDDPRDAFLLMLHERLVALQRENGALEARLRDVERLPAPRVRVVGGDVAACFVITVVTALPPPTAVGFATEILDACPSAAIVIPASRPMSHRFVSEALVRTEKYCRMSRVGEALLASPAFRDLFATDSSYIRVANAMRGPDCAMAQRSMYCAQQCTIACATSRGAEGTVVGFERRAGDVVSVLYEAEEPDPWVVATADRALIMRVG